MKSYCRSQENPSVKRNKITECRLCQAEIELLNSHVLPDFFIKQIEFFNGDNMRLRQPHVMLASTGGRNRGISAKQRGSWEKWEGEKERLFCVDCEQRFSTWESYARRALYGNMSPPCPKVKIGEEIPYITIPNIQPEIAYRIGYLQYAPFKLFQLSMIYRASVASGPMFQYVKLGDRHTSRIRMMLLNADPGKHLDYPCQMVSYEDGDCGHVDVCSTPHSGRDEKGGRFYHFVIGGYGWFYHVSSHEKPRSSAHAIRENGEVVILAASGDKFMNKMMRILEQIDSEWVKKQFL